MTKKHRKLSGEKNRREDIGNFPVNWLNFLNFYILNKELIHMYENEGTIITKFKVKYSQG